MSRPRSSTLVSKLDACSQARWTPAELCHRVVAVLEEDLLVELLGPHQPDGCIDAVVAAHVEVPYELVQEQPPQALGRAGVAGEESPLHHLWQVDQSEDRAVEVREVTPEDVRLCGGPTFLRVRDIDGVMAHATSQPTRRAPSWWRMLGVLERTSAALIGNNPDRPTCERTTCGHLPDR